jgi:hypothetical protein
VENGFFLWRIVSSQRGDETFGIEIRVISKDGRVAKENQHPEESMEQSLFSRTR